MRTFRTLASFLFIALFTSLSAQTNFSGFNYQAVVRDVNGDPLPNQSVSLRVHIHIGASSGYSETHSVTTDDHGLINVVMGEGTPEPGSALPTFGDLDWDGGVMLYEVGVDITGGTSYTTIGSGPLKAVPYAIHALTSGSGGSQPVDNDGDGWSPPYDRNDSNPAIKGAWDGGSSNIYNMLVSVLQRRTRTCTWWVR